MPKKIIVGLGNPESKYDNTLHNVGFVILNAFSNRYNIVSKKENKLFSKCGTRKVVLNGNDCDLVLAWPTTFVNNSGTAVLALLNWFKLEPQDLIVVHDDVALNLGKIRISFNSGAGGHHGVESIIQTLGGIEGFTRLRVGVGPDPGGDQRKDYVLRKFSSDEEKILSKVINISIEAIETIITKDVQEAMNLFNGKEVVGQ